MFRYASFTNLLELPGSFWVMSFMKSPFRVASAESAKFMKVETGDATYNSHVPKNKPKHMN